jgi:biopolymer transport protein ExbD
MSRRRRRRFGKRQSGKEDMVLQITSMADIFTIILVFLLKSFATGASSATPTRDILLPETVNNAPVPEMMKIEISETGVLFEDKPVADLQNFRFSPNELESDGTARALNTLFHERKRAPASIATAAESPNSTGENAQPSDPSSGLLLLADKKTPYTTIKTIMDTAAGNGFSEFKFVVVGSE